MWESQSNSLFYTGSCTKQHRVDPQTVCAELYGFSLLRVLSHGTVKLKCCHCDEWITNGGAIEKVKYTNHACR